MFSSATGTLRKLTGPVDDGLIAAAVHAGAARRRQRHHLDAIRVRARDIQGCPDDGRPRVVASLRGLHPGVLPVAMRKGLASLAHLKAQAPLPETADELCAVARDLGR